MNRDELIAILNDSTLVEVEIEYLADKIIALIAPELEKAKRYDKADVLIQQFKTSAPTDRHVIGLINSFVGIIETLAGKEANDA